MTANNLWQDSELINNAFEELYKKKKFGSTAFTLDKNRLKKEAKENGIGARDFDSMYKQFEQFKLAEKRRQKQEEINESDITDQPIKQYTGEFKVDDEGITGYNYDTEEEDTISTTPMVVTYIYKDIISRKEKVKIDYRLRGQWYYLLIDKKTISDSNKITMALSEYGIDIINLNAVSLVKYFNQIINLNEHNIKIVKSTDKLGYIDRTNDFVPYCDSVKFSGEETYKTLFESVRVEGDKDLWLEKINLLLIKPEIKLIINASFASALISKLNVLPFMVHFWGGTGNGKTVTMQVAASVWGDPQDGALLRTLNGTMVGLERTAAVCNNIPLCLNELQTIRNKNNFDNIIYMLCEGKGKERGAKGGGLQELSTWRNIAMTNGEMPILTDSSGEGAKNRVIEIEFSNDMYKNIDIADLLDVILDNYGHSGKEFIEIINDIPKSELKRLYKSYVEYFKEKDITGKQCSLGAILELANYITSKYIFKCKYENSELLENLLKTKNDINTSIYSKDKIIELIASNPYKFISSENDREDWGRISDKEEGCTYYYCYFMCNKLKDLLKSWNFLIKPTIKYLQQIKFIEGTSSVVKKINGYSVRCYKLKISCIDGTEDLKEINNGDLPF